MAIVLEYVLSGNAAFTAFDFSNRNARKSFA